MKYAIFNHNRVLELRIESIKIVPSGGITLTDAQYSDIRAGAKIVVNGEVIANPNPPTQI